MKNSILKTLAYLVLTLVFTALVSCGSGGSGDDNNTNSASEFTVIIGPSDQFIGTVTAESSDVTRLTGESLFGYIDVIGLAYDPDAGIVYAYLSRRYELATIDLATGEITVLGPLRNASPLVSLAYNTTNDTLYGINLDDELVSIAPDTRTATVVGEIGYDNLGALTYDAATDVFFCVRFFPSPYTLIRIDPANGTGTEVNDLNNDPGLLAVKDGVLYGLNRTTNAVMTIDKTTALTTAFGVTGYASPDAMLYYPPDDRFYVSGRHSNSNGNVLIKVNPGNASATIAAHLGFNPITGMAYDPASGTLYATETSGDNLISIDIATAQPSVIGPLGLPLSDVQGLAWDPNGGTLYGVDTGGQFLITIDTTTGDGSIIAGSLPTGIRSLAYDPNHDVLYGVSTGTGDDVLYTLDTSDGSATTIGNLGVSGVEGLAYDNSTDILYGINTDVDGNGQRLAINTTTGAATIAGTIGPFNVTALTFEPGTGVMYANNAGADTLTQIDPDTGLASGINHTGLFSLESLAYDEANHRYYSSTGSYLVGIDPDNGSATGIAPMDAPNVYQLAYDPNTGVLYGYDINPRQMLTIDTTTGETTALGAPLSNPLSGLAFDSRNNRLYGIIETDLYTFDTSTGVSTNIGPTGTGRIFYLTYDPDNDTLYGVATTDAGSTLYRVNRTSGDLTVVQRYDYVITAIAYR
ncbi:MAG: hypothetical protein IT488_09450 [Gammaproteobacteria bacterium]|nr:hypothetical protein [Gammaproteobacteria bacterium]